MGKSCKDVAQALVDCMQKNSWVKNGGRVKECIKSEGAREGGLGECEVLRIAYFNCKRASLDMRTRIRGPRIY
jgi:hypothetical protein